MSTQQTDAELNTIIANATQLVPSPGSIAGQRRRHSQISSSGEGGAVGDGRVNAGDRKDGPEQDGGEKMQTAD